MDAMGTNSYRCKCQNPKKADHIVEVNKMVPTPRADALDDQNPLNMHDNTDTPQNACPHCGAEYQGGKEYFECKAGVREGSGAYRSDLCREREARQKAEAEVERLTEELTKGARILATIVTALEDAVPWIKGTLNPATEESSATQL